MFIAIQVSIPQWFNQNSSFRISPSKKPECFNSTMVQSKLTATWQFVQRTRFQFHNGSIKTLRRLGSSFNGHGFNSTMVQSKLQTFLRFLPQKRVSIPQWFNQNYKLFIYFLHAFILFQFHNGSIKTSQDFLFSHYLLCFNSTMVQSKLFLNKFLFLAAVQFQFHNGSIKTEYSKITEIFNFSFNSTMVQSKLFSFFFFKFLYFLFQFHNGSIKTQMKKGIWAVECVFQFHNGSIKTFTRSNSNF